MGRILGALPIIVLHEYGIQCKLLAFNMYCQMLTRESGTKRYVCVA